MTGESGDGTGPERAHRWGRHEGVVTTAVLTAVFVVVALWGIGAGWDTGSLAALGVGAVLMGMLTVGSLRRSTGR